MDYGDGSSVRNDGTVSAVVEQRNSTEDSSMPLLTQANGNRPVREEEDGEDGCPDAESGDANGVHSDGGGYGSAGGGNHHKEEDTNLRDTTTTSTTPTTSVADTGVDVSQGSDMDISDDEGAEEEEVEEEGEEEEEDEEVGEEEGIEEEEEEEPDEGPISPTVTTPTKNRKRRASGRGITTSIITATAGSGSGSGGGGSGCRETIDKLEKVRKALRYRLDMSPDISIVEKDKFLDDLLAYLLADWNRREFKRLRNHC